MTDPRRIATAIIQRPDGRILLLRRSPTHTTNAGKWCFVTGYVEPDEEPIQTVVREAREEIGLDITPTRAGDIVVVHADWGPTLHVYPFLCPVGEMEEVTIEQEHTAYVWIMPEELYDYDFVQQLDDDLKSLGLLE
jgi:8-oxo-dGTP pyrophosphatase MutT (NUDIX family)